MEMASESDDGSGLGFLSILHRVPDSDQENEEEEKQLDGSLRGAAPSPSLAVQRHHLISIGAAIVTRQLPSQGLSFQLWPAASSLVSLLDRDPSRILPPSASPLRILELGSGTGLVGIAAAAVLGARVTLTDLPHVLPNLEFNALANADLVAARSGSLSIRQLRWGVADDFDALGSRLPFDALIASDVVYYDHLIQPLLETLRVFVKREVVFVMAHLRRWKKRDGVFFRKARKLFEVAVVHTDPPLPGCRNCVTVYRFTARRRDGGCRGSQYLRSRTRLAVATRNDISRSRHRRKQMRRPHHRRIA
ncbi:L-galactono-1,4-lactone dehydrogenase [Apostasia shenzhenica]|uniref:L-galactono-1,4-lactone dehydrogenase n=1 Tax=Apostasia shenzhenica TaxID=1088818 RepID=A0A2I0BDX0_9ASPA|nr:L-galactono-1,4-lactone dehydrogenase [Apostasia shenzhenica]